MLKSLPEDEPCSHQYFNTDIPAVTLDLSYYCGLKEYQPLTFDLLCAKRLFLLFCAQIAPECAAFDRHRGQSVCVNTSEWMNNECVNVCQWSVCGKYQLSPRRGGGRL